MNAKPIIICILATLVLSSVAFAKPYGEKSRPDSVGDIVFADGTATVCACKHCGQQFTDGMKEWKEMSAIGRARRLYPAQPHDQHNVRNLPVRRRCRARGEHFPQCAENPPV